MQLAKVPRFIYGDIHAYNNLLDSCIRSKSLNQGKLIHQHFLKRNQIHFFDSKLTHLYTVCNQVHLARQLFDKTPNPGVVTWNLMIRSYATNGPLKEAVEMYYKMLKSGFKPTKFTFPFVLKACSGLQAMEDGKAVHQLAKRLNLESDVYVSTALIDFYAKCGDLDQAFLVFSKMVYRDVVVWNAMISGFSLNGAYEQAIRFFVDMQKIDGLIPNISSIVALLPALARAKALREGKAVHGYTIRICFDHNSEVVRTGILDMYAKCDRIVYAKTVFDSIGIKNEVTWSSMIRAYVMSDLMKEAAKLFHEMLMTMTMTLTPVTLGIIVSGCAKFSDIDGGRCLQCYAIKTGFALNLMVGNTFVSLYAKCGIIDDAVSYLHEMSFRDTVTYTAIISGCVQSGKAEEALRFVHEMQSLNIQPDLTTMLSLLPACSHSTALQHGACCHSYSIVSGFTYKTPICNALIDMYSKCGELDSAREVFNRMVKKDIVSWNTMISGYGVHGYGNDSISLFHNMLSTGLKPDDVTFLCLLSACSHSGLVLEGKKWFGSMSKDFNVIPRLDHFICMIDLLGRAGLLDEARGFMNDMPFEGDVRVWGALLACCRMHKNVELGDEASKKIESLGPEGNGNFVMVSNFYSDAERWVDAANVRVLQKDRGFKKSAGCSRVEYSM